jgi:mannose-6-phosphate isomerase-like protein (cupin superfamily)
MLAYEISELIERQSQGEKRYFEFLKVPELSMGVYVLKAGERDPQSPHNEDEVYYILEGKGKIFVGGEDREVQPGSIVYVAKHIEHRFHTIVEDLKILVFFAPAET